MVQWLRLHACSVAQSCPTLCNPMDCSPQGSSIHGMSQQEYWTRLPFPPSGDLPNPGIELASLDVSCIGKQILYIEPPRKPHWLRLQDSKAEVAGSIPGQGTKVLHVTWCSRKKERVREREREKGRKEGLNKDSRIGNESGEKI